MHKLNVYLKLMRFDKPIGILLLLWPTYWALWLASSFKPTFYHTILFGLGVVVMRAAGCVVNDIADRHIDKHVWRTQQRPLTSGQVSLLEAIGLLVVLLCLALAIVLQLNKACLYWAVLGLLITFIYPFCKRFIKAPQMVLGFAFSWGIPMVYTAVDNMSMITWQLMFITYCWIIVYDTMYAMADRKDDLIIGINSTAILFGEFDKIIILILQCLIQILWLMLIVELQLPSLFYCIWFIASVLFVYQQYLIKDRDPKLCFKAFLNSHWYGFIYWLGFVLLQAVG